MENQFLLSDVVEAGGINDPIIMLNTGFIGYYIDITDHPSHEQSLHPFFFLMILVVLQMTVMY